MKDHRWAAWGAAAAALALLLAAAGCGKSLRSGGSISSISRVTVAPATDGTVQAGETKKFLAVAAAENGQAVTSDFSWSVDPKELGTVAEQGAEALFTGKAPGSGKIVATAGNGSKGEFPIAVTAGAVADVRVEAVNNKTSIEAGDTETFKATGVDLGGNVVGTSRARVILSAAWSVQGGIGTIDSTGVFTAAGAGIGKSGQIIAKINDMQGSLTVNIAAPTTRAIYVGADTCKTCHADAYAQWQTTAHATAFDRKTANGTMKPSCVSCHVVGYGKGGYVDNATTPGLTNIQCENCHGPGSLHVAGNGDKSKILTGAQVFSKPEICGGCHVGTSHGTFDEWKTSPHAENTPEGASTIPSATQLGTCGVCHGGLARQVARDKGKAAMPTDADFVALATTTAQTCATCHDPHQKTAHEFQLRAPTSSTAFYTVDHNGDTKAQIAAADAGINICGGCHNTRNGYWQSAGRPPHHSPQYNMLVGDVGQAPPDAKDPLKAILPVLSNPAPATAQSAHRSVEGQCTHCHMYSKAANHTTGAPGVFGHTFRVNYSGCVPCHSEADAGARRSATQADTVQRINALKARFDTWATTLSPSALRTKYGTLAWEYTNEGALSNATGDPAIAGPTAAEQKTIPVEIQRARWNLYIVLHDGSYGVHNAKFAGYLLDQANAKLDSLGVPK